VLVNQVYDFPGVEPFHLSTWRQTVLAPAIKPCPVCQQFPRNPGSSLLYRQGLVQSGVDLPGKQVN
jgi:hypothetical protein